MKLILSFIKPEFKFIIDTFKVLSKKEVFSFNKKKSYIYELKDKNSNFLLANLNMGLVFSVSSLQKILDSYNINEVLILASVASKKNNLSKLVFINEFEFNKKSFQYENIKIEKKNTYSNLEEFKNISYDRIVKNDEIESLKDNFTSVDMEKSYISYVLKMNNIDFSCISVVVDDGNINFKNIKKNYDSKIEEMRKLIKLFLD